jgi:alpha-galactosidase
MKRFLSCILLLLCVVSPWAQNNDAKQLAPTPPMGWMTWNMFGERINEQLIREMADAMVDGGFVAAGYKYVYIDDGWQGGRDNRNNIIPDPKKFPSGMKALADYVHSKGLKLGIYSDASQLTCAGYTASYGFEIQDAKTFASWGIDYLKYDYCGAPEDVATAKARYKAIADALRQSGRDIVLGICEWGPRKPWQWGKEVGGQLWRTTYDVRDKWLDMKDGGLGILDIINQTADLYAYAAPGAWNDMDMLVVGLNGTGGPSSDLNSHGCNFAEYQTQMSMWSMMASPLAMSCDLRKATADDKRILLNKEVIAINQDVLGKPAVPKVRNNNYQVYVRTLSGDKYAVAILNLDNKPSKIAVTFAQLGLNGKYNVRDIWMHQQIAKGAKGWQGTVNSHQTKVFVLSNKK